MNATETTTQAPVQTPMCFRYMLSVTNISAGGREVQALDTQDGHRVVWYARIKAEPRWANDYENRIATRWMEAQVGQMSGLTICGTPEQYRAFAAFMRLVSNEMVAMNERLASTRVSCPFDQLDK